MFWYDICMQFIRSVRKVSPEKPNGKTILYMLGYGGYAWQAKRQVKLLQNEGYYLVVLDFRDVLKRHDPKDLIRLMNEVSSLVSGEGLLNKNTIILGVSLGGLVGYNLIRRYKVLDKLLVITGGDMTHVPLAYSLKKHWKLDRQALAERWQEVNIYTPIGKLRDKHVIMLLPKRDRLINPNEVRDEILLQSKHNDFTIIRTNGGHFRTIISQTILRPQCALPLIRQLEKS